MNELEKEFNRLNLNTSQDDKGDVEDKPLSGFEEEFKKLGLGNEKNEDSTTAYDAFVSQEREKKLSLDQVKTNIEDMIESAIIVNDQVSILTYLSAMKKSYPDLKDYIDEKRKSYNKEREKKNPKKDIVD
jgi:hypothetical protein